LHLKKGGGKRANSEEEGEGRYCGNADSRVITKERPLCGRKERAKGGVLWGVWFTTSCGGGDVKGHGKGNI